MTQIIEEAKVALLASVDYADNPQGVHDAFEAIVEAETLALGCQSILHDVADPGFELPQDVFDRIVGIAETEAQERDADAEEFVKEYEATKE